MKQGLIDGGTASGTATTLANNEQAATLQTIMSHQNARCYLPGDEHLVAVERSTNGATYGYNPLNGANYTTADIQKGGMDTTFTPSGINGAWKLNTNTPNGTINGLRRDARYLYPIDRLYNANAKGVIRFSGNIGLSGR